jgi:hypothetical protein
VAARRDELGDVPPDGDVVEISATRELLQGHLFSYGDNVGKVADPNDARMITKPKKLPIKKAPSQPNDREAYERGRKELEQEYASGSTFIKAGDHVYVHSRFMEKALAERDSQTQVKPPTYGDGFRNGIHHESRKKSAYRAQGVFLGVCIMGAIIIITSLL